MHHSTEFNLMKKERCLSNSLYSPNQSAYTKHRFTETTILSLNNHLITGIRHQKVFCHCLLDLSVAIDTIDHSILLHRLTSRFGIIDTAITWFKTYLSSRSFYCLWFYIIPLSPFLWRTP